MTKLAQPDALTVRAAGIGDAVQPPEAPRSATRPFAAFEWMLAVRYLRPKRADGYISVISIISLAGIALGVATLIVVMAVMNGFRIEFLHRIMGLEGNIVVQGVGGALPDYDAIARRVATVPAVTSVTPTVYGQALVSRGGATLAVLVRGVRAADLSHLETVAPSLPPSAIQAYRGEDAVMVGVGLAERFGLAVGSPITLIAPSGNVTPFGVTPRIKTYTVAGIFSSGMDEYDSGLVFMPLAEAQLYFNMGDTVSGLEVMIRNPEDMTALTQPVSDAAGPNAVVKSWASKSRAIADQIDIERNVMFLILALIILVAALNIISGMIMLVKDKSGDIAILRTMGATRGAVMRVFFIAGASIGIFGTLLGFGLGMVFCAYINEIQSFLSWVFGIRLFNAGVYHLTKMPEHIEFGDVISVLGMSLLLSILATLPPSWRAARLDPVEGLRYE